MILINFFGAPGSGKSTAAALMYARLKQRKYRAEMVRECTKECVYAGEKQSDVDAGTVLTVHETEVNLLSPHCDFVVTDSPFLLSACYTDEQSVQQRAIKMHYDRPSYNVHLNMPRSFDYRTDGRWETFEEAANRDIGILKFVRDVIGDFNMLCEFGEFSFSHAKTIIDELEKAHELLYSRKDGR